MATAGSGSLSAKVPKEDQDGVDMMPPGDTPAEGWYQGSAAGLYAPDRAGEAQVAQKGAPHQRGEAQRAALLEQAEEALVARERASQPAATALRNGRADQETRRSTRTHEDITDRQKDLHVIPQRRAAEEEKKTTQQSRLPSIREQQASLVRWVSAKRAEAGRILSEVRLAAAEILTPAEARREPAVAWTAATETLTPAEARREPAVAWPAATEIPTPAEARREPAVARPAATETLTPA